MQLFIIFKKSQGATCYSRVKIICCLVGDITQSQSTCLALQDTQVQSFLGNTHESGDRQGRVYTVSLVLV